MMGRPEDFGAVPVSSRPEDFGAVPVAGEYGHGVWDSLVSGYQNSATGLLVRGRLPDVQLDPSHMHWYEKALQGMAGTVSDLPEMAVGYSLGGAVGGLAGSVAGPEGAATGAKLGANAGAMAVPAEIRESLIRAYQSGDAGSSGDFLSRASIVMKGLTDPEVLKATGKQALVGALTGGAGLAAKPYGALAENAAQIGTMTVASSALEGKLPEPMDFVNSAIVVGGLKVAGRVAAKMGQIYAKTGVAPEQVVADAHADPAIAEELKAPTPINETPAAYAPLEAAENAKRAIPDSSQGADAIKAIPDDLPWKTEPLENRPASWNLPDYKTDEEAAASVVAYMQKPFGDIPQAPGEPKVDLYPNFNYINTADDVKAALARASELYGDRILTQTRGTVSWLTTEQQAADRLAEMAGVKDTSLLTDRQPGTGAGATEMYLRSQLMQAAVEDFTRKAKAYDAVKSSPEEAIQMQAAAERVAMLSANFQGAASETGRALNAIKMMNSGLRQADAIRKLMEGSPDPAVVSEIMKSVDNPVAAAEVARKAFEPKALTTMQKVGQVWKAGLLSGTKTYIVKAIGDSVALSSNVAERAIAAGIGFLHGGEKVTPEEATGLIAGMQEGVRGALRVSGETWKAQGMPQGAENPWGYRSVFGGVGEDQPEPGSAKDMANRAVALPHRIMGMETEGFRTLNELGEARALAIRQAISENFTPNTDEFNSRVADIEKNPPQAMAEAIKKAGDDGTFTGQVGKMGQIMHSISEHPIGQFVVPFSTVPANLVTWALKRMPGVANLLLDVQEDFKAGGARRDIAIARQIVGATVATAAYGAVKNGTLTGGGQGMTPDEKQAKVDAGWQPYSIKVGDKYYSYNRFEPLARIASLAADTAEIHDHLSDDDKASLPLMLSAMFGNALVSQTYLSGLNQFMQALADPAREGPRVFDSFTGSWVPAMLGQIASSTDPNVRRVDSAIDAMQSRIPYLRNQMLPKINGLTGEPLENKSSMLPIDVTKISNDPVLMEASRLNVGVSKAPKSIELPAAKQKDIGKVELTPEQQNIFSTASGQMTHQIMSGIVGTDQWENMSDMVKKAVFDKALEAGRKVGRAEALTPEQRQAEVVRISEELTARMMK